MPWQGPGPLAARLRSSLAALAAASPDRPGAISRPSPPAAQAAFRRCLGAAAAGAGVPLGTPPVLEASLTYQGAPAEVFVFDGGRPSRRRGDG